MSWAASSLDSVCMSVHPSVRWSPATLLNVKTWMSMCPQARRGPSGAESGPPCGPLGMHAVQGAVPTRRAWVWGFGPGWALRGASGAGHVPGLPSAEEAFSVWLQPPGGFPASPGSDLSLSEDVQPPSQPGSSCRPPPNAPPIFALTHFLPGEKPPPYAP